MKKSIQLLIGLAMTLAVSGQAQTIRNDVFWDTADGTSQVCKMIL